MWNGKKKAVTFSFDDGVTQDIKTIEILNKYGLKATFNLNSGFLGNKGAEDVNGARRDKVLASKVKEIYQGHEIAVHTLTHPNLTLLEEETIIRQVELDRKMLEDLCGYEIVGMAYPCGGVNNDDRVAEIIRKNTPIRYARTITSTHNFDLQENLLRFNPTVYHMEQDKLAGLMEEFLAKDVDEPQLFYFWGHTYEFDWKQGNWEAFESVCKKLAGRDDIFYGTNKEVLL
ncbi:MAG: polysaccharide deacetylase family protein [Clostridia bacterium]|nr:polysaccharide deacetylase family protein [Clostridia bacterium]